MTKNIAIAMFLISFGCLGRLAAAEAKPAYKWIAGTEYYLLLPTAQDLRLPAAGVTESVKPWGLGIRAVGNGPFGKTAGLQLQSVKVDSPSTGNSTFYLLDLLLGMEYMTPKKPGRPLRFSAAAFADLGLSGSTLYAAPVLTAGFLYSTDNMALTPTGLTLNIFYRLTDLDLDDAANGKAVTLKPALGLKAGYAFQGFWTSKEKE